MFNFYVRPLLRALASRAWVDPDRCVGCAVCVGSCDSEAMHLPVFDFEDEERRVEDLVNERRQRGEAVWLAFVGADIDGGLAHFREERWKRRLPGYLVVGIPTASWLRSKWLERLLKWGVSGVLVVRDSRIEALARDGNQWIGDRLAGDRMPAFRPARAGGSEAWRVVDFNPADERALTLAAGAFRTNDSDVLPVQQAHPGMRKWIAAVLLSTVLMAASIGPSHLRVSNPAPADPELVFAFRAFGEIINDQEFVDDERRPVHMRGRSTIKPERAPVRVQLKVDGEWREREYRAKGISRDGPAIDEWRQPLEPVPREVEIRVFTSADEPPLTWSGTIQARKRHIEVITYDPPEGFRASP